MIKLLFKIGFYTLMILLSLEGMVRVLHLAKDTPIRHIDEHKVEKWVADQTGYSVTGNRNQNFSEYKINNFGFNSYREFAPSPNKTEIAIVGDSFIQGFHQDYINSIGKKIENYLPNVHVYEYGYAGYDFADQLHLIKAYKKDFDFIDYVVVYLNFEDDLSRNKYKVIHERLAVQSPKNLLIKKIKLLVYIKSIGLLDPPIDFISNLISLLKKNKTKSYFVKKKITSNSIKIKEKQNLQKAANFKNLVALYGFDTSRFSLLLDSRKTPKEFLNYLSTNNFHVLDFAEEFEKTTIPTNLIYDQHWNNYGRTLIAKKITKSFKSRNDTQRVYNPLNN